MKDNGIGCVVCELIKTYQVHYAVDPQYVCLSPTSRAKLSRDQPDNLFGITVSARSKYTSQIRVEGVLPNGKLGGCEGRWVDETKELDKRKNNFKIRRQAFKKRTAARAKKVYNAKTMEEFEMVKASYYVDLAQIMFEGDE